MDAGMRRQDGDVSRRLARKCDGIDGRRLALQLIQDLPAGVVGQALALPTCR